MILVNIRKRHTFLTMDAVSIFYLHISVEQRNSDTSSFAPPNLYRNSLFNLEPSRGLLRGNLY